MNLYRKSVYEFCVKYRLEQVTAESLKQAINKAGYKTIYFNQHSNKQEVEKLLISLHIAEFASTEKAFTYADAYNRIVFIADTLSEPEALIVLAHEAGHIQLGHLGNKTFIVGQDIKQEYEANEFAHYLLNCSNLFSFYMYVVRNKNKFVAAALIAAVLIGTSIFTAAGLLRDSGNDTFYVTEHGEKYHQKDCMYIKGKSNLTNNTKEELEKEGYEPCEACLPN